MKHLIITMVLCMFCAYGKTELCREDVAWYDIPQSLVTSIISVFTLGTTMSYTGCPKLYQVNSNKIVFWLYNKEHRTTPIRLDPNNPSEIDSSQKIIFVIHGWTCNITGSGLTEMKNAYQQRYPNVNLIFIEWTTYSVDYYVTSFCRAPKIAEVVGKFICNLSSGYGVDVNTLHLVGHSMGAQIAGLTGQETQRQCLKKIGRITGLDPAGPLYQLLPKSRRLDASDATIVDVIHTNQGVLGYYGSCGTVDYYPNCGYSQPGCREIIFTTNINKLINIPFTSLICSHQRSILYFTESILTNNFKATSCTLCPGASLARVCVNDFFYKSVSSMGEDYPRNTGASSKYYLTTNNLAPFAQT